MFEMCVWVSCWVPVTERVPEDGQKVIAYDTVNGVHEMLHYVTREGSIWTEPVEEYFNYTDVICWMPMPTPPEDTNRCF